MNKKINLSIVVGSEGLIGSHIANMLQKRGDYVIGIDRHPNLLTENINFFNFPLKKYKNISTIISIINPMQVNIFFAHGYKEEINYETKPCISRNSYFSKVINTWKNSSSINFINAIESQICFIDDFLKKIIDILISKKIYTNIILFGSSFEKNCYLIDYFYNRKKFIFKHPAYIVSKKALLSYQNFLVDLFKNNLIFINTISPGVVERNQNNFFVKKIKKNTPGCKKLVSPSDISNIALFLTNIEVKHSINNQVIYSDSGWIL